MKIPIKILLVLSISNGLTYKQMQKRTGFHVNTVSRQISFLDRKGFLDIRQEKSKNLRGKKWVNVVSLKEEFFSEGIGEFFEKIAKKLGVSINDLFVG